MLKVLKYIIYTILAAILIVGAVGYYLLSTFDLNKYKVQVSQLVEKYTGQKLEINGDANLKVSLIPTLVVNDVKLTDAGASYVADFKYLETQVAILPLLKKEIVVDHVLVKDSHVQYGKDKIGINNLAASVGSMDDNIKADFDVVVDGNPITGNLDVGSINTLLNSSDYPVNVNAKAFGADLKVSGILKDVMKDLSFVLDVDAYNPNGNFGAPETKLITKVDGNLKKVNANISSLSLAKNIITGTVSADISGKIPSITANLKSDLINIPSLKSPQKVSYLPEIIGSAQALQAVPDDAVPYELMNLVNANVNLNIKKLIIDDGMDAANVIGKAVLNNGHLNVSPLTFGFGGGTVNAVLTADAKTRQVAIKVTSNKVPLQSLHKEFAVESGGDFGVLEGGALDIDIDLTTSGATYRKLSENIGGRSIIMVDKSKFQTGKLTIINLPFITQVLQMIKIGNSVNKEVDLQCAVIRTDFGGGKAKFHKSIALESSQFNLVSNGNINLVNDAIEFELQPVAGKISVTSIATALGSFAKISGTLENPHISLDEKQALKTAAGYALGGPIYAGGAALIDSNSAPCYTALAGTAYSERYPKPEGVVASSQQNIKDVGKSLEKSVRDVRDNLLGVFNKK